MFTKSFRLVTSLIVIVTLAGYTGIARAGDDGNGGTPPAPVPTSDGGQSFFFTARPGVAASQPDLHDPNLVASGLGQPPDLAAAGIPSDDRENNSPVAWYVYEHQTASDINTMAANNNLRVVDLYVESAPSPSLMTAVYVTNSGSYAKSWGYYVDVTPAVLQSVVAADTYRIVVLKAFNDPASGGDVRYFALFIANTGADAKAWWYYHNLSVTQVTALWQANNARLVQVNSYVKSATTLYDVVMISNTGSDARSWWWYVNASMSDISAYSSANNARLVDLDIDPTTGKYNVIMNSCSGGCPTWAWYVGLPSADLLNTVMSNGERIIDANSIAGCGDRCWSIVLIDNSVQTLAFNSIGAQDGWVLESSEKSGVGGSLNAGAPTIRLGDTADKKQYRGILSFNTGPGLPDNAVITAVTLKVRQQAIAGPGNPLAIFHGFMADVKTGFFGTAALQTGDFKNPANQTLGPFLPALTGGSYSIDLTGAQEAINKLAAGGGLTQIRLRFTLDDNNNALANYLSLFSGNAAAANRPQLVIQYYVPVP